MSISEEPLFSVLCTNYNNGPYITEMVQSLLDQTYSNWELIFVDDGSTDNSILIIKSFQFDPRIKIFSSQTNVGAGAAAVLAARHAQGVIMGRLDADDALTINAIDVMIKAHSQYPAASLITSQVVACNNQLQPVPIPWVQYKPLPEGMSILEHPTVGAFASFKASSYLQTEGFDPSLRRAVDIDIYIKLEEKGEVVVLEDELYLYRQNIHGISQGHNGTLAKALAYQVMVDAFFRRRSIGYTPNLSRKQARNYCTRQHQIQILQPLHVTKPWLSLFSFITKFPELLLSPTIWRNTISATIRNTKRIKP